MNRVYSTTGKVIKMSDNNEKFKLLSRRYIAWPVVGAAIAGALFLIVYGAVTKQEYMVTLGAGALFMEMATIIGFYFGKKTSEE